MLPAAAWDPLGTVVAVPSQDGGFVHCASYEQVAGVLERYFAGADVVVVELDVRTLESSGSAVVWEAGVDPQTGEPSAAVTNPSSDAGTAGDPGVFPHVYGPIARAAVGDWLFRPFKRSGGR